MTARYTTLLFDFDHTLFDSDASETAAFDITMRGIGVDEPGRYFDRYVEINRMLWRRVEQGEIGPNDVRVARFEQMVGEFDLDTDPNDMAATFLTGLADNGDWYPGARDVIEQLAATRRLVIVTNAISEVQRPRLVRIGALEYFSDIVISTEVGLNKPDPAFFDVVFERLDQPDRRSVLMIGDSLSSDIAGGFSSGIDTAWYNPRGAALRGEARPTHELASLEELITIVR